ncbi:MAG: hypothetical protein KAJ15_14275, partial [Spirochaetes bacterium]|nr:hypothetical protein [Spirochaetota bacterium]
SCSYHSLCGLCVLGGFFGCGRRLRYEDDRPNQQVLRYILFRDPIVVEAKAGKIIIQPQRTNNILEQFFRTLMRTYRKKNGFQAMERALKAMLKDTPLVMNLRNKDFMKIFLNGKRDLAQRFADVDAEIVHRQMHMSTEQVRRR